MTSPHTRIAIGTLVLLLGSSTAGARDSHHPDPMSILDGSFFKKRVRKSAAKNEENNVTKRQPWRMYTRRKEQKYILKPEPYSLAVKKKDPELLGPQRTYKVGAEVLSASTDTNRTQPPKVTTPSISTETCIAMIGKEKYDHYVEKYGGPKGALRRCLVLKRSQ
jgi:hypothetical protein